MKLLLIFKIKLLFYFERDLQVLFLKPYHGIELLWSLQIKKSQEKSLVTSKRLTWNKSSPKIRWYKFSVDEKSLRWKSYKLNGKANSEFTYHTCRLQLLKLFYNNYTICILFFLPTVMS